jgi:hypothetical protein
MSMIHKTPEDFQRAATAHNIQQWYIHDCSICKYPCGFVFQQGQVTYDSGCDCIRGGYNRTPRTWEDVAAQYNRQTHPDVIAQYDALWFPEGHVEELLPPGAGKAVEIVADMNTARLTSDFYKRRGTLVFTQDVYEGESETVAQALQFLTFWPREVTCEYWRQEMRLSGCCAQFDVVETGQILPEYHLAVTVDKDGVITQVSPLRRPCDPVKPLEY